MQNMLISLGYNCGNSGADGDFGKNTLSALKQFQKDHNLNIDGIYGPASKTALEEAYQNKSVKKENVIP